MSSSIATHPSILSNLSLIDIWLKAQLAYQQQPGVAVGIVYDQEIIYAKGFGTKGVISADSLFRIASHSKLFAAISIMQLRDTGKLRLDDPIIEHLPWFSIQNKFDDAPALTIRQLLVHTSGLPREAGSAYWIDFDFPTFDQVKQRLSSLQTALPSETRWKYSNLALAIIGEVVAQVSGQPFEHYVEQHILEPLAMDSTSVVFPEKHRDRLVSGYGRRMPDGSREQFPFIDARGMAAATGMTSSVNDMLKFVKWQFRVLAGEKNAVLKTSTLREMQRPHWVEPTWNEGRGIAFGIAHKAGRELVGHAGGYPGYLTNTRISAREKLGVVVFMNSLDAQPMAITEHIFEWLAPVIKKVLAGQKGDVTKPEWRALTGTYRTHWGDSHIQLLDGKLCIISPTLSNPKSMLFTLDPIDDQRFIMNGKNGGRAIGEEVIFELDESGMAKRVKIGDNWMEKITYSVTESD